MNWIQEEETGSNTEPRQEINHIQSANSVIRIDVYKAILLVERQLIEFVIDTGSPVTNIPAIISPNDIQETTNCIVDVKKNTKNFNGEVMVEVQPKEVTTNCRFPSRKIKITAVI